MNFAKITNLVVGSYFSGFFDPFDGFFNGQIVNLPFFKKNLDRARFGLELGLPQPMTKKLIRFAYYFKFLKKEVQKKMKRDLKSLEQQKSEKFVDGVLEICQKGCQQKNVQWKSSKDLEEKKISGIKGMKRRSTPNKKKKIIKKLKWKENIEQVVILRVSPQNAQRTAQEDDIEEKYKEWETLMPTKQQLAEKAAR